MSKHKHPKSKKAKAKSSPKKASAPAKGGKVNWHRIIWQLSEPDPKHDDEGFFRDNFYHETSGNRFWLEPEAYTGPNVTIGIDAFAANSLCFRIRFADGEMRDPWMDCVLFPAGTEALEFHEDGAPIWAAGAMRLEGRTTVDGHDTLLTICMDEGHQPTELHIRAEKEDIGTHRGAGVAHQ